jgi:uncharacterized membrane protein YqaE (UPF0057 family)
MKYIKPLILILSSCFIMLSLTSFSILTAVISPVNGSGRTLESVTGIKRADFSIIEAPLKISALDFQAAGMNKMTMESLLSLTPAQYKQMTGKRLGFFKSMELKMVQKQMKKQKDDASGGDLPQWAYVVLSIFALGWLAIGVRSNWKGNDWWIALLLYFVFYFPGLIYSLIVMNKYY